MIFITHILSHYLIYKYSIVNLNDSPLSVALFLIVIITITKSLLF